MMELILIAAMGKNRELGFQNDMPWKRALPSDLAFFKKQTAHHAMVMGRKTFESFPGLLPGRKHIVISHTPKEELIQAKQKAWPKREKERDFTNLEVFDSLEAFFKAYIDYTDPIYVIGGGSLYQALFPLASTLYLTEIDESFLADVYFPNFDKEGFLKEKLDQVEENGYHYQHIRYQRKKT